MLFGSDNAEHIFEDKDSLEEVFLEEEKLTKQRRKRRKGFSRNRGLTEETTAALVHVLNYSIF